jgi:hypothetical protein
LPWLADDIHELRSTTENDFQELRSTTENAAQGAAFMQLRVVLVIGL